MGEGRHNNKGAKKGLAQPREPEEEFTVFVYVQVQGYGRKRDAKDMVKRMGERLRLEFGERVKVDHISTLKTSDEVITLPEEASE